jgi:hypothetical protein
MADRLYKPVQVREMRQGALQRQLSVMKICQSKVTMKVTVACALVQRLERRLGPMPQLKPGAISIRLPVVPGPPTRCRCCGSVWKWTVTSTCCHVPWCHYCAALFATAYGTKAFLDCLAPLINKRHEYRWACHHEPRTPEVEALRLEVLNDYS